ncbi:MAG: carboxyltransferase domain-containing protein, partial [Mycobacterium sp.]
AVPRRAEPRSAVPPGAVGLAGEFTGIYPRRSPGGWQLIGHTDAVLWDIDRPNPALLTPGTWVQFRAAGST